MRDANQVVVGDIGPEDFDMFPAGTITIDEFLAVIAERRRRLEAIAMERKLAGLPTGRDPLEPPTYLLRLYHPAEFEKFSNGEAHATRRSVFQAVVDSVLTCCPWEIYVSALIEIETECPRL